MILTDAKGQTYRLHFSHSPHQAWNDAIGRGARKTKRMTYCTIHPVEPGAKCEPGCEKNIDAAVRGVALCPVRGYGGAFVNFDYEKGRKIALERALLETRHHTGTSVAEPLRTRDGRLLVARDGAHRLVPPRVFSKADRTRFWQTYLGRPRPKSKQDLGREYVRLFEQRDALHARMLAINEELSRRG